MEPGRTILLAMCINNTSTRLEDLARTTMQYSTVQYSTEEDIGPPCSTAPQCRAVSVLPAQFTPGGQAYLYPHCWGHQHGGIMDCGIAWQYRKCCFRHSIKTLPLLSHKCYSQKILLSRPLQQNNKASSSLKIIWFQVIISCPMTASSILYNST